MELSLLFFRNEVWKLPILNLRSSKRGSCGVLDFWQCPLLLVCSILRMKTWWLCTFSRTLWITPPFRSRSLERKPSSSSWWLLLSRCGRVIVDPSWPHFQLPRPACFKFPRFPRGIPRWALTTRPSSWSRPQQNSSHLLSLMRTFLLASSFPAEIALQPRHSRQNRAADDWWLDR